jgi:hypothetical protein
LRAEESVHAHFPAYVIRVARHIAGGKIVQNIACGNEGGGTGEPPCIIGFDESQSDFVGGAYADPRSRPHTRARRLVEFFGSVEGVFNAPLTELEAAGLPAQAAQSICTGRSIELAHDELAKAGASGIQIVAMDDAEYPSRLRQIYDPPVVLYVRGNVAAVSQPGIAVVGMRHPTPYGMGMAERLGCDLAARGLPSSADWRVEWTHFRIGERSQQKARQSRCLARAWTSSIRRRIRGWPIRYSVWAED